MHNEKDGATYDIAALVAALETEPTTALSALCAAAKKQVWREAILSRPAAREKARALLGASEPKTVKNAARLLGALGHAEDAHALCAALEQERTLYVLPSILLALGSVGGEEARKAVCAYTPPVAETEAENANVQEIARALNKAKNALSAQEDTQADAGKSTLFDVAREVLLVAPEGFADVLMEELAQKGITAQADKLGARVVTDQPQKLFSARCFLELLVPLGEGVELDPAKIAACADALLPRPYRVELRGYAGDRAAFIGAICLALGGGDNPSAYTAELRVVCTKKTCGLFIRPFSLRDGRFAYRKKALAASIKPAAAACLCRYALSFVQAERVRALDPFCGSGTLLFELEKTGRASALLGVDVAPAAIAAARVNAEAAHSRAQFVQKDCLRFAAREPFDLIVTNLPFGNRVGTHESNEVLYRAFVKRLPELLDANGVALLYTMEYKLLSSLLNRSGALRVEVARTTEAGGLLPRVVIVKKR